MGWKSRAGWSVGVNFCVKCKRVTDEFRALCPKCKKELLEGMREPKYEKGKKKQKL